MIRVDTQTGDVVRVGETSERDLLPGIGPVRSADVRPDGSVHLLLAGGDRAIIHIDRHSGLVSGLEYIPSDPGSTRGRRWRS